MKKILAVFAFVLGLSLPSLSYSVQAADENTCLDNYYLFLIDARSENARVSYFKDFVNPNYCKVNDILALYDQLDSVRESFRSAALTCSDTSLYQEQYQRILMEVYLVRNMKDFDLLYDEMRETFVVDEGRVSQTVFDQYFENWEGKYANKEEDYLFCDEGAFGELQESWEDFTETWQAIQDSGQAIHNSFSQREEVSLFDNTNAEGDINGRSVIDTWTYFKQLKEANEADDEFDTISDLVEETGGLGFIEALDQLTDSSYNYEADLASSERLARYEILYGEGGALVTTDIQTVLQELNRILLESNTKDFPSIQLNAAKVYDKQCN